MSLTVSAKSTSFPVIPEETYSAVCVGLYDIGEQYNEKFKKASFQVVLVWELMDVTYTDSETGEERNRTISSTYTANLNEKSNLRKMLKGWRGREFTDEELKKFNLKTIIGVPCLLQVIHSKGKDGNTYANVGSVTKLPKAMPVPVAQTEPVAFNLDTIESPDEIDSLPKWIKNRIVDSITFKLRFGEEKLKELEDGDPDNEEDLPF